MKASSGLALFAAFYMGMVLLKDGTLPNLARKAGDFVATGAQGLRPLTRVG